jgi:hypothetical protein
MFNGMTMMELYCWLSVDRLMLLSVERMVLVMTMCETWSGFEFFCETEWAAYDVGVFRKGTVVTGR